MSDLLISAVTYVGFAALSFGTAMLASSMIKAHVLEPLSLLRKLKAQPSPSKFGLPLDWTMPGPSASHLYGLAYAWLCMYRKPVVASLASGSAYLNENALQQALNNALRHSELGGSIGIFTLNGMNHSPAAEAHYMRVLADEVQLLRDGKGMMPGVDAKTFELATVDEMRDCAARIVRLLRTRTPSLQFTLTDLFPPFDVGVRF
jgi:hypothetical protein